MPDIPLVPLPPPGENPVIELSKIGFRAVDVDEIVERVSPSLLTYKNYDCMIALQYIVTELVKQIREDAEDAKMTTSLELIRGYEKRSSDLLGEFSYMKGMSLTEEGRVALKKYREGKDNVQEAT